MPRLRITTLLAAFVLPLLLCTGRAQAQTQVPIDYFNFNSSNTANTGTVKSGTLDTSNFIVAPTYTGTAGTSLNAQPTIAAGNGFSISNGSTGPTGNKTYGVNNGKYLQFDTKTTGYNSLSLSYATSASSTTAFTTQSLSYSINNSGTYTDLGSYTISTTVVKVNYILDNTIFANQNAVSFRITFTGGSTAGGDVASNDRIDNLTLTGVTPAPAGLVSMGIGLGMAGLGALVRRRRMARTA